MLFYSAFALTFLSVFVVGQDLGVPTTWRKFSNSRPLSERISIAQNAINTIMPRLTASTGEFSGIGYWQSGNVWTSAANQDLYAGTTVNKDRVINNLNLVFNLRQNYDQYGWWAQAALVAYRAYRDNNMLSHAIAVWNHVTSFAITANQASTGSLPGKNFALARSCEGKTMAGGVFWRPTNDDKSINSITTGLYMTTSAILAEITGDAKYRNAAILSANWIKNLNINSDGIVLDSVNGNDCSRSPSSWRFTYNSGKYIEGLSVLADVTGDNQWRTLMVQIVAAAVKSTAWQGTDGIITEGASPSSNNDGVGFKAIFIRGLYEAFIRNASNTNLRILIHSYIDVQYNALLDLARNGDSYSSNWHGPTQGFTTWGQMAALDVLGSAIITNN